MIITANPGCPPAEVVVDGTNAAIVAVGDINLGNWANSSGRLIVTNGGTITAPLVYGWSQGTIVVSGSGSFVNGLSAITDGLILIERGGKARPGIFGVTIGYWTTNPAVATVTGSGSQWYGISTLNMGGLTGTNSYELIGNGTLNVLAGGNVGSSSANLGRNYFARGRATISGANSLWTSTNQIILGVPGEGTLNVENNGRVETSSMYVGYTGTGNLNILSQGRLNCNFGYLAYTTGSVAQATVAGSGARWAVTNTLKIGGQSSLVPGGMGTLSVSNGGLVTVGTRLTTWPQGTVNVVNGGGIGVGFIDPIFVLSNTVVIGTGGTLDGNGTILGNVLVGNGGIIQPGLSIGTLTLSNALTLAGRAVLEINRTNLPTSDLIRAKAVSFGGTLDVTNTGGALLLDDTFQLFASTNATGHFATLQLPPLNAGLGWDASGLLIDGTIKVASTTNRPAIQPAQLASGTNLQIKVKTLTGVKYVLETTTNLNLPILWKRAATNDGTGDLLPFDYRINPPSQVFFRITAEQ